jgi:kojibiose phosphorylase
MADMLERKNRAYLQSLQSMDASSLLPGAVALIGEARAAGLKLAVASASRNAEAVLLRTGIRDLFDLVMDGNSNLPSKPAPDLFMRVAQQLGIAPGNCAVLEDAAVGIDAALAAGMWSVGLGPAHRVGRAHVRFDGLEGVTLAGVLAGLEHACD